APGVDLLDKLSQATGNAQAPNRESVRHACLWKATIMLFSRYKVAYEKKRKIMRNVASVAELTRSFFAEIDKVENPKSVNHFKWTVIRLDRTGIGPNDHFRAAKITGPHLSGP